METTVAAVQMAPPTAAVEVWATDEHRIGLKPMLRRVWAPKGKRPVIAIHPRYRWRSLSGYVHPASGQTQWHLSSSSTVELFTHSLAAFAEQVGAGPTKESILVLDRAGWHMSRRLTVPAHLHLIPLPPYTPELQPAERLWSFSKTRRSSTCVRPISKSWTRSNSIAVRRCRLIPLSSPPSSRRLTITGGLPTILQ